MALSLSSDLLRSRTLTAIIRVEAERTAFVARTHASRVHYQSRFSIRATHHCTRGVVWVTIILNKDTSEPRRRIDGVEPEHTEEVLPHVDLTGQVDDLERPARRRELRGTRCRHVLELAQ